MTLSKFYSSELSLGIEKITKWAQSLLDESTGWLSPFDHQTKQLWESQQEAEKQPWKLQEQMDKIVLEGNNARATLHKRTIECTKIFQEVSDWMGIIVRRNQTLEDMSKRIQFLKEEVAFTMHLLEQQEKFDQI